LFPGEAKVGKELPKKRNGKHLRSKTIVQQGLFRPQFDGFQPNPAMVSIRATPEITI
jgi:hypothetical protein